jgi:hypothetical protein
VVIAAISMFMLLGFSAFAIDFGYVYGIKNKLQNAADSAALAGASVLFSHNELCNASGSPYSCCNGNRTGSCDPTVVDVDNVEDTAQALAALNNSGGIATTVTVEIGHYAFADDWDSPGTFDPIGNNNAQMTGWETMSFSDLNDCNGINDCDGTGTTPLFINAVKVTVTREDVPRFFSRIWGSSDFSATVQAIAYLGFAGSIAPGEADQPIAICEQAITTASGGFECNVGTMLNNNTQTSRWSNFEQGDGCGTSTPVSSRPLICSGGNPDPIMFGEGMSTTNGTQANVMADMYDCWMNGQYDTNDDGIPDASIDTDNDGKPDRTWKIKVPVIDCSGNNNCRTVVGTVVVNVVWINKNNSRHLGHADAWVPSAMVHPNTGLEWTHDVDKTPTENWNDFVGAFNLQNNNLTGDAEWADMALYFLPDCSPDIPSGGTGGKNFGIMARHPKLVK